MEQWTVTVMCFGIGGTSTSLSTSVTVLSQFLRSAGSPLGTAIKSKSLVHVHVGTQSARYALHCC